MTTQNRKFHALLAVLALVVFTSLLFFPALFQGKILAPLDITTTLLQPWAQDADGRKPHNHNPSDAVTQYLPYRVFAEKSLREDGYIGWNPYEMGGYSLAENTMALPGSWPMQLHRFLAFKDAWNIGILLDFLIAGTGMLVFLRSRNLPWLPCLIGTIAFAFNSQFIIWIYHRWALGSFCWMPWVLWSYSNGFSLKHLSTRSFLLPGFLALAILGGSIQHLAFIILACGCMAMSSFDFRRPHKNMTSFIGWTFVLLLALGISAFSLIPQIQGYLSNISIGHTRGGMGYANGISQPFFNALLIPLRIWPWLAGDPQSIDAWRLLGSRFMELNFIGTVPMILGFASLFLRSMPKAAKWLVAVGLIIPLTPLVGPLYHRVELLFILGAAWMTAEMLARLPELTSKFRWQRWLIASTSAIGAILVIATCIPTDTRSKFENQAVSKALAESADAQFGSDQEWIASRAREWTRRFSLTHPRTAWVYGLLVVGTAGLVLSSRRHTSTARTGQVLLLCATSLELVTVFHIWTTFSKPEDLHPSNHAVEAIRTLAGPHRVTQNSPDAKFADKFATPNVLASFSIPSIDAYESIQYRSPVIALRDQPPSLQLSLAGVGLAVYPTTKTPPHGTEAWETTPLSEQYNLRKNPSVPAMISASALALPTTPKAILESLASAYPISPTLRTTNRISFEVPEEARWIRLTQNWHQGWRWRTPSQSWQPFRNGSDAACWIDAIPKGTTRIEVKFFPRSPWLTFVSIGTLIAWLGLLLVGMSRYTRLSSMPAENSKQNV